MELPTVKLLILSGPRLLPFAAATIQAVCRRNHLHMIHADASRQIVLKIQREYRLIINQLIPKEEIEVFRKANLAQRRVLVADRIVEGTPRVIVPGGNISSFEDRLNRIARDVYAFWKANGEALNAALRDLQGFKLATTIPSLDTPDFDLNIRRLCVYFDSLLLVCPIHESEGRLETRYGPRVIKDPDELRSKLHIAVNLISIILTESLLSADTSMPMVVVVPDTYACRDDCEIVDVSSGNLLIGHLTGDAGKPGSNLITRDLVQIINKRYRNNTSFKEVFDELLTNEYADYLPPEIRDVHLKNAPFEVKIAEFLANVGEAATDFNILSTCAAATAADPIIVKHKQRVFRGYLEVGAEKAAREFELARDSAIVAQGLLAKNMGFLEALSFNDLRIMRTEGMLEQTRESLRKERERFRKANYNTLSSAGDQFAERFVEIIEDTGKSHIERDSQLRADIRKNAVYFAGACAMGAASIALPQTMFLQVLGLGYSTVIGGSALEINSALKDRKIERAQFEQNPLGILYGALKRSSK